MPRRFHALAAGLAGLLLLIALPALADITVIGHYVFANGDTLTRPSYFTNKRIRTTLPDGDEVIYDYKANRIALVDHARRMYWEGPRAQGDSIAARLRAERFNATMATLTPEAEAKWNEVYAALGGQLQVEKTENTRKIAGYPCTEWTLTAGPYLRQERWVARSLAMPDFGPEIEKVVLASMADPVGRGLMSVVLKARAVDGLTLAGRMRVKTFEREGEMSWEAVKVLSGAIPKEAWAVPQGYQRWEPKPADAGK